LLRFLVEERAQSFLVNMYERTMTFLAQRSISREHPAQAESYTALATRLRDQREGIVGATNHQQPSIPIETASKPDTFALEIDKRTGCRICGQILEAVFRFLSKHQYELSINPQAQQEHANRGGFCPLHTWQYEGISSPYGVCTAYPVLTHRLAAELSTIASHVMQPGQSGNSVRDLLPTTKTCRVCEGHIEAEKKAVEEVAATAQHADSAKATKVSACCLPHLRMVLGSLGSGEIAQKLLVSHANLLGRTAEDLQRYALRHDALRRYLTSEEERRASQLALLLLAGHRNVISPWVIEDIL
jgi:hypothetical protein